MDGTQVHTIIQFRAIDFGMEDCRLVLTLPALGETLEAGASLSMTPGSRIELFHLAAPRPIDVQALTYRSQPRAQGSVGSVVVDGKGGDVEFYKFPCKWSSLHAFEVQCVEGTECALDVWSSHNTTYGEWELVVDVLMWMLTGCVCRCEHGPASDDLKT